MFACLSLFVHVLTDIPQALLCLSFLARLRKCHSKLSWGNNTLCNHIFFIQLHEVTLSTQVNPAGSITSFPVRSLVALQMLFVFTLISEHWPYVRMHVCVCLSAQSHLAPCGKEIKHFPQKFNFFSGLFYWVFVTIATNQTLLLGVVVRSSIPACAFVPPCVFVLLMRLPEDFFQRFDLVSC